MSIGDKQRSQIAAIFSGACREKHICPVKDIMAAYGDKWSMYTVLLLGQFRSMRFNELLSHIDGISQRMLTVTLRSLEQDGIAARKIYSEIPPHVEYCLTELGESLLMQIFSLGQWAEKNHLAIIKSRKKYGRMHVG